MVASRLPNDLSPTEIPYRPTGDRRLPVEVLDRCDVIRRITEGGVPGRQRLTFHLLMLCTSGAGAHEVDFETLQLTPGTVVLVHPGQVQRFVLSAQFTAPMVVWPAESDHPDPAGPRWFPGGDAPTTWQLDAGRLGQFVGWIDEMRASQAGFDGSIRRIDLGRLQLATLLTRLRLETPGATHDHRRLPEAYRALRELLEHRLRDRPTVTDLARELGYSTRTLDRACEQAVGMTAKHVVDDRIALEVRRQLMYTSRPVGEISRALGFTDPSNFSKFVKRQLGHSPNELREQAFAAHDD